MKLSFEGKIAAGTGSSQDIGKGIVVRLVSEYAAEIIADCNKGSTSEAALQMTINTRVQSHPYPINSHRMLEYRRPNRCSTRLRPIGTTA